MLLSLSLMLALTSCPAVGSETFENPVIAEDWPDPTVWRDGDGTFYSVATWLKTIRRSTNLVDWEDTGKDPLTPEARYALTNLTQDVWAPSVVRIGSKWMMYVSLYLEADDCRIAVLSSSSPTGPFDFKGFVIKSQREGILNTIDPYVLVADGKAWIFFGSCQDGIHCARLTDDGQALLPGGRISHVAGLRFDPKREMWGSSGAWEGVYILFRRGWWYLFASEGRYNDYSYHMVVGRSRQIDGTYLDRKGLPLTLGLADPVLSSSAGERFYGPGHNGDVFTAADGSDWMFFHAHDAKRARADDRPTFLQELKWTDDGWPYFEDGCPQLRSRRPVLLPSRASAADPVAYRPADWNLEARRKFAEQRFGIFIHWGLYANYAQGEWYQQQIGMDTATYGRMMDGFCPSKFDAKEWVRVFKGAGAKYVTITSRHHDGFSLWPTKADDGYNVANTPFKRDILGELSKACDEAGLQLNFYYSLMDWHRKDYPAGDAACKVLGPQKGDYASYKRFMMAQIAELIDGYHPGNIWFDGEWEHARHQPDGTWRRTLDWEFDDIYDLIHSKHTLVANNNHQPIRAKEDIQLFERDLPGDNSDAGFSANQPVSRDRPIEQCDVIQDNVWGYRINERKFRTAEDVVAMLARAAANDANLLMNIGPDGSGRLPALAVEVMANVGEWMAKNGESIYGTTAGGIGLLKDVVSTRKGNVLYLHFLNPKVNKFAFKLDGEVEEAKCLACGDVRIERTASGDAVVTVARPDGFSFDIVVRIAVKGV